MPHGMLDPWFQRHPSRRTKAIRNWLYWSLVESGTIASADGLLFTCQRELELARTTFRSYRPKREENVGYGVLAPPPAQPAMHDALRTMVPSLGDRPYLLYLSRIHPKKGVDLLIRAYCRVTAERNGRGLPSPDLLIAGPGDRHYVSAMRELAASTRRGGAAAPASVHFPGMLAGDAKWGAFYGCEAFVLPSHQENFGIAVVESLACGKPVLISNQVNIWDEIVAAEAGFADEDTEGGVHRMLERFLGLDRNEREALAASARACYRLHYRPDSAARRLLDAIGLGDPAPSVTRVEITTP